MNTKPKVQLYLFFATENDTALILRRAKDREYNLIGWDRRTDRFTVGQWIKKYVTPQFCSLSPDGQHFMYFVANADPRRPASEAYTVISRPPWFTALALYPQGGVWVAGGKFLGNDLYMIEGGDRTHDLIGQGNGLSRVFKAEATKDCRTGLRLSNGKPAVLSRQLRDRLLNGVEDRPATAADDYETQSGRLYRKNGTELTLVADFTEMDPRFAPAPYDSGAVENRTAVWHPLDNERPR